MASRMIGLFPPEAIHFLSRNQWRVPAFRKVFAFGAGLVRNQDGVIQHGVGKGLKFNAGVSHSGFIFGTHKPSLQKALADLLTPGMTVFDAGANVGYYGVICARLVGATGKVICFEPLAANADRIKHNAALNGFTNLQVRCEALGAVDGIAAFLESQESTWGSLKSVGTVPDKFKGEVEVPLRQLDTIMRETKLPRPNLIKIDVEGSEIDLLKGANDTITAARPILTIELHNTNTAIHEALKSFGYEAIVMDYRESIVDAPWNAYVLAAPRERADQIAIIRKFSPASASSGQ